MNDTKQKKGRTLRDGEALSFDMMFMDTSSPSASNKTADSTVIALTNARMQFDAANATRCASGRPAYPEREFRRISDSISGTIKSEPFAVPHSLGTANVEARALRDAALRSRYARPPIQN